MQYYRKEQLENMSEQELRNIASTLNIPHNNPAEDLIYDILDAQAIARAEQSVTEPHRKRTRIEEKSGSRLFGFERADATLPGSCSGRGDSSQSH